MDLNIHVVLLRNLLKGFLLEVDLDAATKLELLEKPASTQWQSPNVQAKMVEAWGSHSMYQSMLALFGVIQDELSAQLDSDLTLAGFAQDKLTQAEVMGRVRFTWRSSQRKKMLQEIKKCNDVLDKLLNAREKARPFDKQEIAEKFESECDACAPAQQVYDALAQCCLCDLGMV